VKSSSWLAVRARSQKLREAPFSSFARSFRAGLRDTEEHAPSFTTAFGEDNGSHLACPPGGFRGADGRKTKIQYLLSPAGPEMTEAVFRRGRTALLREISIRENEIPGPGQADKLKIVVELAKDTRDAGGPPGQACPRLLRQYQPVPVPWRGRGVFATSGSLNGFQRSSEKRHCKNG